MTEYNRYGDGTVFEGVRSTDSVIPTLQLAIDLEGPHGMITLQQAAAELRRLHEVNQKLYEALDALRAELFLHAEGNYFRPLLDKAEDALAKARGESHD